MSRDADKQISDILTRYGEPFGGSIWRVQGTAVIYHKTLERIATQAGVRFDIPTVIRAERDEAVLMVVGRIPAKDGQPERLEWSLGEALVNVNYRVSGKQAAYVYAMAEKRGKDRVILKLIELSGLVYSEEEADEFRARAGNVPEEEDEAAAVARRHIADCERAIEASADAVELREWWNSDNRKRGFRENQLDEAEGRALGELVRRRIAELDGAAALALGSGRVAA